MVPTKDQVSLTWGPLFHSAATEAELRLSYVTQLHRKSAELNSLVTLHTQTRAKYHKIY